MLKRRIKFFISTKADLLEKKVNAWLDENETEDCNCNVVCVTPVMSYAGQYGYMYGCSIEYVQLISTEEENGEITDPIDSMFDTLNSVEPTLNY